MHAYVIGNAAVDETIAVAGLPVAGASIHGRARAPDLGGKGANQAVVMARAGLPTTLVVAVGEDARAAAIRAGLATEPVTARLVALAGHATDLSIVLTTPDGENAIVTTNDCAGNLAAAEAVAALGPARPGDLAVLQGNLSDDTTHGVLAAARTRGMVTAFNPSPPRPALAGLWPLVDIAVLNTDEARAMTGESGAAAARRLIAEGVGTVALTLGADGALLATAAGETHVPALNRAVVDTTGAGDAFFGTALASAARRGTGLDVRAVEDATRAAALAVGRPGTLTAFPSVAELAAILSA